jgi:hypothetical protein
VEPIRESARPSDELQNFKHRKLDEFNKTGFSSLITVGDWGVVTRLHLKFSTNLE